MQEETQESKIVEMPAVELEPSNEPDFEALFPIGDFDNTVLLVFKAAAQGAPIQIEIVGDTYTARTAKSGGIHEFLRTNGRLIEVDGHDVLWAEAITDKEHRDRTIAHARAEAAKAKVEELEKAVKAKAEEEARANEVKRLEAEARMNPVQKPRGLLPFFRG